MLLRMTLKDKTRDLVMDRSVVTLNEERALLNQLGWTWSEWAGHLGDEHPDAQAFAWWLACRRDGEPTDGKARDLDWAYGDMTWDAITDDESEEPAEPDAEPDDGEPHPTSSPQTEENEPVLRAI